MHYDERYQQILSAGAMGRLLRFSWVESAAVGVGMCGRAEMAFVLASLGLSLGMFDATLFSIVIFTTFLLNMITPTGGVSPKNLGEFLSVPAVLACGGSWLTPADQIAAGNYEAITALAAEAIAIARTARG